MRGCGVTRLRGLAVLAPNLFEAFATPFRRESFTFHGFLRGEKVAKPDEGGVHPTFQTPSEKCGLSNA